MKIQQFRILKFQSSRLKESKYNIPDITIDIARLNGELISISNSEMVRVIHRVTGKKFSQIEVDELKSLKKSISYRKNNKTNRNKVVSLMNEIDSLTFIPELISVSFDDKRHFQNILDADGFVVNGTRYKPFMASAGMVRRDTVLFISSDIFDVVDYILNNNRDRNVKIVPAKFLAYYGLYASSTHPVAFPDIVIVPDLTITDTKRVDFSTYVGGNADPTIEEKDMELEFNAFDGQGLCSPNYAKLVKSQLELDYVPSIVGIRAPFIKGMLCVFDFHKFAEEVAGTDVITDIYGDVHKIRDVDCIISESQFKLWSSYPSTKDYVNACSQNELSFGITAVNPKVDKNHARSSYQFLQVLSLNDEQIDSLCKPTLDWLDGISTGDIEHTLMFLLGENRFDDGWFDNLDPILKALLLNNDLIHDSFYRNYLHRIINKKKNDARMGRLMFEGNYQTMISDPYCQAGHVFGLGVKPLLQDEQHFSEYWNNKGVEQVACIRSPIVHSSEVDVLNFRDDEDTEEWYKHVRSGIIFPAYGIGLDNAILGGADNDLDICCTIQSPEIIQGREKGLPVVYDVVKGTKEKLEFEYQDKLNDAVQRQISTNKIGFITNVSSSLYSLLYEFEVGSPEYNAILKRLTYGRHAQGREIDRAKSGVVEPSIPEHFVKWVRITDDMTEDERIAQEFNNSVLADKRPYFMRYLYPHYNRRWMNERKSLDNISWGRVDMSLNDLESLYNPTDEQLEILDYYKNRSYFIDNDSTMNRISKHIDGSLGETKLKQRAGKFDVESLLSSTGKRPSRFDLEKAKLLYKEWKSHRRSIREKSENRFESYDALNEYTNKRAYATISPNTDDIVNILVVTCYKELGVHAKSFLWQVFGEEVVWSMTQERTEKYIRVPMLNPKSKTKYLWSGYTVYTLNLEI